MDKLIFILTILVLCVSGCLSEKGVYQSNYDFSGIDKIAIVAVDGQISNPDAKVQIADLFIMELLSKGYAPIPLTQSRSKVEEIAKSGKQPLSSIGYTQMGQMLDVPAVLVINVPYFDNEISMNAQLIDTKDGSVLWMDQDFGNTKSGKQSSSFGNNNKAQEDLLMDPLLMLNRPATVAPAPQQMSARPGDRPLNPQELQKTRIIVSKICSSLPSAQIYKPAPAVTPDSTIKLKKPKTSSSW